LYDDCRTLAYVRRSSYKTEVSGAGESPSTGALTLLVVAESPILDRIDALVDEEHRLWADSKQGRLDEAGHSRLEAIRRELDRCWDLLRRRRVNPDAPEVPPRVPDPENDLEGPEPEPPHLEHGVHTDVPAPDPDIPRNIP
jgi:Protein of unknown function (DUF2630)